LTTAPTTTALHDRASAAIAPSAAIRRTFSFMAQPHLKRGALVSLFDNWRRPSQTIQLVYPANRHLSAKLRVFVDWAVEMFAGQLSTTKLPKP
jgi:DNA-binding transcriptional LysR family regulator